MRLSSEQADRAGGVLLGQAIGDALGVPYEFGPPIELGTAAMIGGGLGPYAPGEWSDDTQMAVCIAQATAAGPFGQTTLDAVVAAFVRWAREGASDIGVQTSMVLRQAMDAPENLPAMQAAALDAAADGRAGNGALMRTSIVGLVALDDPERTAQAASDVARLTHAHHLCVESSILWSEAVRLAVVEGRLDLRAGVRLLGEDRRAFWQDAIGQAETQPPAIFGRNGFTVTALQAAWSAIHSTRHIAGPDHVEAALQAAIAIGHDTDTVAAIAGGLLGARYGVSGLKTDWTRRVHGWPGLRARDLVALALATAIGELPLDHRKSSMVTGGRPGLAVPHPDDPHVLLGTEADLARCADLGVTAVVSLSRVGADDIASTNVAPGKHVSVWLVDSDDPRKNAHLPWTIADAARTVSALREGGDRVLLHCVAAEHRTPSVALAYSALIGKSAAAAERIEAARRPPGGRFALGDRTGHLCSSGPAGPCSAVNLDSEGDRSWT